MKTSSESLPDSNWETFEECALVLVPSNPERYFIRCSWGLNVDQPASVSRLDKERLCFFATFCTVVARPGGFTGRGEICRRDGSAGGSYADITEMERVKFVMKGGHISKTSSNGCVTK